MTFSNDSDFISFRHHVFVKTGHKDAQLAEVGPRFEMRCKLSLDIIIMSVVYSYLMLFWFIVYEIKLGTVDLTDADSEWHLTPFTRTAHKRVQL